MTVKNRIDLIRLAEKLKKNQDYANKIGIHVINSKAEEKTLNEREINK